MDKKMLPIDLLAIGKDHGCLIRGRFPRDSETSIKLTRTKRNI